ncbi:hypothetical protein H6G04_27075 [Calothrix membranacea FACHB-236]|nr:hypothetical protein [Calothrix membranacea FACHB-236]
MMNLTLHDGQLKIFNNKSRFKLVVAGRRFGKSRYLLTEAITKALSFNQPIDPASPPVVLLGIPTLKQARQVHWQSILNLLEKAPFVEDISKSDYRVVFKGSRPHLLLRGTDSDADGLRGLKIDWAGLDEFQDFSLASWEQVIFPALSDTPNSSASIIATPKGRAHWLYKFHINAKADRDWSYFHFITKDNPFVPRKFLQQAKLTLPPRVFLQEFEADFTNFEGQILSEFGDHHIVDNLPTTFVGTYLGLDWGDLHPALCVVGLAQDKSYYIIDEWTNPNPTTPVVFDQILEKASYFCDRYNIYRCFADPSRPASILEFQRYGKNRKIPGLAKTVAGFNRVKEGNQTVNNLFFQNRLFINSKLGSFADELRSYHRKTKDGEIIDEVAPGQEDHRTDSLRYVLATIEQRNNLLK